MTSRQRYYAALEDVASIARLLIDPEFKDDPYRRAAVEDMLAGRLETLADAKEQYLGYRS